MKENTVIAILIVGFLSVCAFALWLDHTESIEKIRAGKPTEEVKP